MAGEFLAQFTIPYKSGIAEDVVTNTFSFRYLGSGNPGTGDLQDVRDNLKAFYSGIFGQNASNAAMANYIDKNNARIKIYDRADPKPRVPVLEESFALDVFVETATVLPPEVAAVLSFRTEYESGISKASQRGRVYLGGLGDACATAGATSQPSKLKVEFITRMYSSATTLAAASLADDWGWVIWSEKLEQSFAVAGGWVDNAWDTQRRRGMPATTRTLWNS